MKAYEGVITKKGYTAEIESFCRRLKRLNPGEKIDFSELESVAGKSSSTSGFKYILDRARYRLRQEDRMVFSQKKNVGVFRLTDTEILKTGTKIVNSVNRATERGLDTLRCVNDFHALSAADQVKHNSLVTVSRAINRTTSAASLDAIERKIQEVGGRFLTFEETIEYFS